MQKMWKILIYHIVKYIRHKKRSTTTAISNAGLDA